jgi:8-oxo-dGTP diphosphatase
VTEPVVQFIWRDSPVPAGLSVTQVYGWLLCPATGRVLIQEHDDGVHSLPGGSPEAYDADMAATLSRESFEENQVRIAPGPVYLGYQEVIGPGQPSYAQVRMVAIILEFAPRGPDPDNGRINQRLMTSLAAAPGILGWGEPAEAQARGAARAARQWGLPIDNPAPDGYED